MSSKDGLYWFVLFLGLVLLLSIASPAGDIDVTNIDSSTLDVERGGSVNVAYIPHNPIYIDENSDFPFFATAGGGSSGNPYIIENLEINSNNTATPCIYIRDTSAHFVIRNCNLTGASVSPGAGVSLYNVWYGEISNNTISNNRYGIFVDNSVNINIINNTCFNNYYGIHLYDWSSYNDMFNNTCNSNYAGIYIDSYCTSTTIKNATCNGNTEYGIYIQDMSDAVIANSSCLYNKYGVYVYTSGTATMDNNVVEFNWVGVIFYDAAYCTLTNSICNYNTFGISVVAGSHHATITNNTVCNNSDIGFILTAYYSTIVNNNISYNVNWGMDGIGGVSYGTVIGNTLNGNGNGGRFTAASTTFVDNEICYNSDTGLYFSAGSGNTIVNNTCNNNGGSGISINDHTSHTIVTNNTCNNNELHGLYLGEYTLNFTVTHNTFSNNSFVSGARGVFIHSITMNHSIIWNVFVDNHDNAEDQQSPTYEGIGPNVFDYNYWADYGGVDANNDSIGDTPYTFTGNSDPHPLVYLPTPPSWNETPTDQIITGYDVLYYKLNVTSYAPVTWSVNDTSNFVIDENGTLESLGMLAVGEYGLTVNVTNIYNFTTLADFKVVVTEVTPPDLNMTTVYFTIEYGDPFYYDLNATDPSGIDTWWLIAGHVANLSVDSDGVVRNATILKVQGYVVRVGVNDTLGNVAWKDVFVTVEDTILPSWVTTPESQLVEFGLEFRYDVNATDLAGINAWWLNSTDFAIDGNGVITNGTLLAEGIYGLEIFVQDRHGNVQSATISITVEDTILPSWVILPENQIIEFGEFFSYDIDVTDLAGTSHWWLNGTDFSIDENGLITNATVLAVGVYGLEISCNDTHGNVLSATITVTVEEAPVTTTTTTTSTTTATTTTDTTTPTSPTTPTGTTSSGLDPMVLLAFGGIGVVVVLILVMFFLKKKS
jgi:parallel beta-helix repeat protein